MTKRFSESVQVANCDRWHEEKRKCAIVCAQLQRLKGTPAGLALLDELIDRLDEMIAPLLPKTRRIRLNSRQFDSIPLVGPDRREFRIQTNQDIDLEEKWLPLLQQTIKPWELQEPPSVTLIYLD